MQVGAIFPQTEMSADPIAIRDYAQAVEDMGYSHIVAFDHVLGANIDTPERRNRSWPYNYKDSFYEPFVLYGYLAAVTRRVGLVTGVVILPQRQTALVAKQAAVVDVLSGGRLRLGIGTGWNDVEYEALGENFHNRGVRSAEQIHVLRALWTDPLVTFKGQWHQINDAGINPLPVQRPIPIWLGGYAEPVLKRVGELADGWLLVGVPMDEAERKMARIQEYARQAGRDPSAIGLEGGLPFRSRNPDQWRQTLESWRRLGATYVSVNTMGAQLHSVSDHIDALRQVKEELGI